MSELHERREVERCAALANALRAVIVAADVPVYATMAALMRTLEIEITAEGRSHCRQVLIGEARAAFANILAHVTAGPKDETSNVVQFRPERA